MDRNNELSTLIKQLSSQNTLRQKVVNKLYNSKIEKTANEIEYEDETYIDNFLQNCIVRDYSGYTFEHIPIGAGKKSIGELYTKLRLRPL